MNNLEKTMKTIHTQMLFLDPGVTLAVERGGTHRCMSCMQLYGVEYLKCPYCGFPARAQAETASAVKPGTSLHRRYILGRQLHTDGFAAVYIGWDTARNQTVLLREYNPDRLCAREGGKPALIRFSGAYRSLFEYGLIQFLNECTLLSSFSVAGLPRVEDVFEENGTAYAVCRYTPGLPLAQVLAQVNSVSQEDALSVVVQLADIVSRLHELGVLHLDITPQTVWLTDEGDVQLLWLGGARHALFAQFRERTAFAENCYAAPDQAREEQALSPATDVYAMAALLYRLISGVEPRGAYERLCAIERTGRDPLSDLSEYSDELTNAQAAAVANALQVRAEDRTPDVITFVGELLEPGKVKRRPCGLKKTDTLKMPFKTTLILGVVSAAATALAVLSMLGVLTPPSTLAAAYQVAPGAVSAPDLTADDYQAAEAALHQLGLRLAVHTKSEKQGAGSNRILQQTPAALSELPFGATVHVTVSTGPGMAVVPDVCERLLDGVDEPENGARRILENLGFNVTVTQENKSGYSENVVFKQSVEPGKAIEKGSEIILTVGSRNDSWLSGREVEIPFLEGKQYKDVRQSLDSSLYIAIEKYVSDPSREDGEIISQVPSGYSNQNVGTCIYVVVNRIDTGLDAPNVTFLPREDAQKRLEELGLQVRVVEEEDPTVDAGVVLRQEPAANQFVSFGAEVTLTVCVHPPVTMPALENVYYTEARQTLLRLGLSSSIEAPAGLNLKKAVVAAQSIPAGEQTPPESNVVLVLKQSD